MIVPDWFFVIYICGFLIAVGLAIWAYWGEEKPEYFKFSMVIASFSL